MKKNFQLSLTTIALLALSACGSSGDDNKPNVSSNNNVNPGPTAPAPTSAATAKAQDAAKKAQEAARKAQATQNPHDAAVAVQEAQAALADAQKAVAEAQAQNVADAAKAEEALKQAAQAVKTAQAAHMAAQQAAEKVLTINTTPIKTGLSNPGYQHAKKRNSNFDADGTGNKLNSANNTGLRMGEQNLYEKLDTFVVAHKGKDIIYLEDVDNRPDAFADAGANKNTITYTGLQVAKVNDGDDKKSSADASSYTNPRPANAKDGTKTQLKGKTADAIGLVYDTKNQQSTTDKDNKQAKRSIYIDTDNNKLDSKTKIGLNLKTSEEIRDFSGADAIEKNTLKPITGKDLQGNNVSELYGVRTRYNQAGTAETDNLPLVDKKLEYVQYGRITSQLSGRDLKDFREGVKAAGYNTKVGNFGYHGAKGTEDHYFARGIQRTTADQVAKLANMYNSNTLTYEGHAVAYGLDNTFRKSDDATGNVPNALHPNYEDEAYLLSGNHVRANVHLDTKAVDGSVYNKWALANEDDKKNNRHARVVEQDLVSFNGELAPNGNIAGTATNYTNTNREGILNATLYGPNASEIGGTIVNKNPSAAENEQWGLSFGGMITNPLKSQGGVPTNPGVGNCADNKCAKP